MLLGSVRGMGQSVSLWEQPLQVRLNIYAETNVAFLEALLQISISLGVPTEYECLHSVVGFLRQQINQVNFKAFRLILHADA